MAMDPRDPWGKKSDPIEDILRQGQALFRQFMPFRGARIIVTIVVALFLLWQGVYIVAPDEEGVVKRFGAVVRTVGPGPHLKIPFMESVLTPKVTKVHRIEVGFRTDLRGRQRMVPREALMLTGDENILAVEFNVQYKIKNAKDWLFNVAGVIETIQKGAEASMREVIGKSKITDVLTVGKAQIQDDTHTLLQALLDQYGAGVTVIAVQIQDVHPPEAVVASFKDVASAKEDREKLINQAEGYRNEIIPQAKGEAAQIVNQAKGYAQARMTRAEGEANRFLAMLKEYSRAKDIISKRIYIETMEEVLPGINKVIIDRKAASGILPYLPLDRLGRSGTATDEKRP